MLSRPGNDAWLIFWRDVMADGYEILIVGTTSAFRDTNC
jgi:hypothetical protein